MTTKQVIEKTAQTAVEASTLDAQNGNPENNKVVGVIPTGTTKPKNTKEPAPAAPSGPSNLFISVKTFDADGKTVGERVVDMYHFGTRNWLQNHHWWAMHNGHCVETNVATPEEIDGYLAQSKQALASKYNKVQAT